jgi:hypothetical protein
MLTRTTRRIAGGGCLALALIICLAPAQPAPAQEPGEHAGQEQVEHLRELLHMLEQGIVALDELDRPDMRDMLNEVAEDVRGTIERARREQREREVRRRGRGELTERQVVEHRLELFRLAFKALMEAEQPDMVGRVEHAIHSYELMLEGHRGPDAQEVRRTAPKLEEEIELLGHAAHLYEQFGMPERAAMILEQRDRLWPGWRVRGRERQREGEPDREREMARHRLEMMHLAMPALREAGRMDAADLLERAIGALEVNLARREDAEARRIRERAPDLGQQIELLMYASKLWAEFGHETKAATLEKYAQDMLRAYRERQARQDRRAEERAAAARERERGRRERRPMTDAEHQMIERIEALQARLAELERAVRDLREHR